MTETVMMWKERVKREGAALFGVSPDSILLIPKDSTRGIKATWQKIGLVRCPANGKEYRTYWGRTIAQFKPGKRLDASGGRKASPQNLLHISGVRKGVALI